jgi:hypothetical protein
MKKFAFVLTGFLFMFSGCCYSQTKITTDSAKKAVGKKVIVTCKVYQVKKTAKAIYLYLDGKFLNKVIRFGVVQVYPVTKVIRFGVVQIGHVTKVIKFSIPHLPDNLITLVKMTNSLGT